MKKSLGTSLIIAILMSGDLQAIAGNSFPKQRAERDEDEIFPGEVQPQSVYAKRAIAAAEERRQRRNLKRKNAFTGATA